MTTSPLRELPAWAALPSAITVVSLLVAVSGYYWDVSWHIDRGRDPGAFANPAHWLIIIGLDPSLSCTGWGIVAKSGNRLTHIANGQVRTDPKASLPERLVTLDRELTDVILHHRPDQGAVEEVFVNQKSTGAANDFERATKMARAMVTKYGMSDSLGVMVYEDDTNESYFGKMGSRTISEAVSSLLRSTGLSVVEFESARSRRY